MNSGDKLTPLTVQAFDEHLRAEDEQREKRESAAKRRRGAVILDLNEVTPNPKKKKRVKTEPNTGLPLEDVFRPAGEVGEAASGTPDPLPKPSKYSVSLKSSVNEKIPKPAAQQ